MQIKRRRVKPKLHEETRVTDKEKKRETRVADKEKANQSCRRKPKLQTTRKPDLDEEDASDTKVVNGGGNRSPRKTFLEEGANQSCVRKGRLNKRYFPVSKVVRYVRMLRRW